MAALFDSMDWVNEENDLSTVIGSDTRIASEMARDDSGNISKQRLRALNLVYGNVSTIRGKEKK